MVLLPANTRPRKRDGFLDTSLYAGVRDSCKSVADGQTSVCSPHDLPSRARSAGSAPVIKAWSLPALCRGRYLLNSAGTSAAGMAPTPNRRPGATTGTLRQAAVGTAKAEPAGCASPLVHSPCCAGTKPCVDPLLRTEGEGESAVSAHGDGIGAQRVEYVELLVTQAELLVVELHAHGLRVGSQIRDESQDAVLRVLQQRRVAALGRYA